LILSRIVVGLLLLPVEKGMPSHTLPIQEILYSTVRYENRVITQLLSLVIYPRHPKQAPTVGIEGPSWGTALECFPNFSIDVAACGFLSLILKIL
jgi:hypothetical protein